ncbi:MAG: hypothetical protein JWM50_1248 [Microbacteriaceae bacterium]|nr:hypothetical protein [Microbacteriaceae bacterium]
MRAFSLGAATGAGDNVGMRRSIALSLALVGTAVVVGSGATLVGAVTPRESSERVSDVAPITVEQAPDAPTPAATPTSTSPAPSNSPVPGATVQPVVPEAPHDVGDDHGGDSGGDSGKGGGGSGGSGGGSDD